MPRKIVFIKGDEEREQIILKHLYDLYLSNHFTTKQLKVLNDFIPDIFYIKNPGLYCCINKNGVIYSKEISDLSLYVDIGYADYFTLDEFLQLCPFLIGERVGLVNIPGIKFTISEKVYLGKDKGFIFRLKEDDSSLDWKLNDFRRE